MNNSLLRFVPMYYDNNKEQELKGLFLSIIKVIVPLNLAVSVVLFLTSNNLAQKVFEEPELGLVLKYFAICIPLMSLIILSGASLQAIKQIYFSVMIREVLHFILAIVLVSTMFLLGQKLQGALVGFLLALTLTALIALYLFKIHFARSMRRTIRPNFSVRKLMAFSFPVLMVGFSYVILTQTDRLMIGFFLDANNVGIYTVAARIAMLMYLVAASFNTIFVPLVSELNSRHEFSKLSLIYKVVTKWCFTFSVVMLVFFLIFSRQLLLLFGEEFIEGLLPLIILSSFLLINASTGSNGLVLQMTGRQNIEFCNALACVIMNIVLNIVLIPEIGIIGAACATGFSLALINIIRLVEVFLLMKMHPFNMTFVKPAIASVAAAVLPLLYFAKSNKTTLSSSIICFLVYLGLYVGIYALFGLDSDDRYLLSMVGNKTMNRT
jgi:O-antigen/teichoic acid export membrane protein